MKVLSTRLAGLGTVAVLVAALGGWTVNTARAETKFAAGTDGIKVSSTALGRTADGRQVDLYTLANANGMTVKVMTYGATLVSVEVPDRQGHFDNVTLSLDGLEDYLAGHPLFGSVVGRYANRIAGARFTLDGTEYKLLANNNGNHIHGGQLGFQKVVWDAVAAPLGDGASVQLYHTSPDGHEGYPGKLAVKMTYTLTNDNQLKMRYVAQTDKPTHLNLTNHAYWNLAGAGSGDVLGHVLMLAAEGFLPANEDKIPLGPVKSVKQSPMDFTKPQSIGSRIDQVPGGYDHCYVLNKEPGCAMSLAARVFEPNSGRVMEVYTTQPGVQLYTANGLDGRLGAKGARYQRYHGLCLETQHFPDSPNRPQFPSTVLRPGQVFDQLTVHKFSVQQ